VSIVDHHGERLAAIHALKSSRNVRQLLDPGRNRRRIAVPRVTRRGRGENVIHIHPPDQGRKQGDGLARHHQIEACAPRSNVDTRRVKVATIPSIAKHHRTAFAAELGQLSAIFVVEVGNRGAGRIGAASLEQHAFGGEILRHRRVIVEMVAREIGKHGHVKGHAIHALLRESVR
jgi:hypothetical protein